ncbi:asparagine synthetase B [Candidatus Woesearchaeota archaeon]|nr:asparagine synthetase B [Candidatus Woesearchaeota archaeon]
MCGIIGLFNASQDVLARVPRAYHLQENRGRDAFGLVQEKNKSERNIFVTKNSSEFSQQLTLLSSSGASHVLLHHLHAIIGSVPQPLSGKGLLVYNGEIYNWKQLAQKNKIKARNDADVLFFLLEKIHTINAAALNTLVTSLDGVFVFAYQRENYVVVCRDRIGERPLAWHFNPSTGLFAFASEGKTLASLGLQHQILEPRTILVYDTVQKQLKEWHQQFFHLPAPGIVRKTRDATTAASLTEQQLIKDILARLTEACRKRLADIDNIGILFSGGLDSTILACLCKKLNKKFTCYTAGYCDGDMNLPKDVVWAKRVCEGLGFPLKITIIKTGALDSIFTQVISIIESTDVVKIGVAAPFFVCAQMARKDGKRVMLSGLGAEELFAGYERHARVLSVQGPAGINSECLAGLYDLWQRDLYRDDLLMMHYSLELRLPFLDHELIDYALGIPGEFKIDTVQKKIILRKVAIALGIPYDIASRKKQAAQYGSNFDKGIAKMAKRKEFSTKAAYLASLSDTQMQHMRSTEIPGQT